MVPSESFVPPILEGVVWIEENYVYILKRVEKDPRVTAFLETIRYEKTPKRTYNGLAVCYKLKN